MSWCSVWTFPCYCNCGYKYCQKSVFCTHHPPTPCFYLPTFQFETNITVDMKKIPTLFSMASLQSNYINIYFWFPGLRAWVGRRGLAAEAPKKANTGAVLITKSLVQKWKIKCPQQHREAFCSIFVFAVWVWTFCYTVRKIRIWRTFMPQNCWINVVNKYAFQYKWAEFTKYTLSIVWISFIQSRSVLNFVNHCKCTFPIFVLQSNQFKIHGLYKSPWTPVQIQKTILIWIRDVILSSKTLKMTP